MLTTTASKGDVVIFAEISRMARSTLQVLEILECCMVQGIFVHIAKQQMVLDDSLPSRITATVLGLVEPDLAGEKVILWWGLFDSELYVEHQETRYGPFTPIGKPIPLHSYRSFKKTNTQKRADRIEQIASQLALPSSALGKIELPVISENVIPFPVRSFVDPDPFEELTFKNAIEAKRAIAHYLVKPLAKLTPEQMTTVESILGETLKKQEVMSRIKDYFHQFN